MIKRLFKQQINSITSAAALVAFSSLLSRILGVLRDRILAGEFGASESLDIYYAAFRIPDLIFNLLVLGALSAGFIPIFSCLIKDDKCKEKVDYKKSPNKEAWELANNVLNVLGIILIVLSAVGIILAPWLMKLIAPGFSDRSQQITAILTRIMFLSPIFLGISSVMGGILQSFKRFFVYSLSPIMYNLGIIIGALYFVPLWGIYGLAWGVVLGAFMHLIIQVPLVGLLGFRYKPKIDLKNKNIRKIGQMMIPRTMSLAISQINLVVITVIASGLAGGSLTVFNFANNLQSFPIGIFGISFAVAAFPVLSAVAFKKDKLVESFSNTIRQILFFIIPSTVLLITLRAQIIRVILGTGKFNWQDTILTIDALGFFALSLFAQAIIPLLVRVFYARHNSSQPFYIGLFVVFVNILLSLKFSKIFGVAGLALAFSISNIINFLLLWIFLYIEIGFLDQTRILISAIKMSAAALMAGIAVQMMKLAIWPYIDMTTFLGVLTQGLVAGAAGVFIYSLFCYLFKVEELDFLLVYFKKRIPKRKIESENQDEARGI